MTAYMVHLTGPAAAAVVLVFCLLVCWPVYVVTKVAQGQMMRFLERRFKRQMRALDGDRTEEDLQRDWQAIVERHGR